MSVITSKRYNLLLASVLLLLLLNTLLNDIKIRNLRVQNSITNQEQIIVDISKNRQIRKNVLNLKELRIDSNMIENVAVSNLLKINQFIYEESGCCIRTLNTN